MKIQQITFEITESENGQLAKDLENIIKNENNKVKFLG